VSGVAEPEGGPLTLQVRHEASPATTEIRTDHVICATGYRADLDRLTMIEPTLRARIRRVNGSPALDGHFQSSVDGLYFAGIAAAMTFGPLMRFMFGTTFASQRLAERLA